MGSNAHRSCFNFWPVCGTGREERVDRFTNTFCTLDYSQGKSGPMSQNEARQHAMRIESACYLAADELFRKEPHGDGTSARQLYAAESSRMVWEVLSEKSETTAKDGTADTLLNISSTKVSTIGALGARAFLKPLTEQRQSYTRLCFRNRSFGLDAANVARPVLESIKEHITELDISGFVASRPEDEALGVMSIFSNALKGSRLRYLNLSDTALSEKGVMAFKELLSSQKDLEELHLMNNGLSGKAARILSKFPSTEKLKVLQMVNNCIGDDGAASIAEMVKRSPNLVSFRCSAAKIGSDGAVALAKALETCIHLDKLDLSDNLYGYEAAATLSESVTKHPVLTVIQIKATSKFARKLQNLKSAENKILDSAKRTLDGIVKNALEGSNKDLRAADLNTNMSLRVGAHCFSQSNTAKPGSMHLNCQASHEGIIGVEDGKNLPTGQE